MVKKHIRLTSKHPNGIIIKRHKRKTTATKNTFKKAGFTKLSSKYLERKANGKKRRK